MSRPLILIAASGLAREVVASLEASSTYRVVGIVDDNADLAGQLVDGVSVLGPLDVVIDHPDTMLLICVGRGVARASIRARLLELGVNDGRFATLVDPTVSVASSVRIGAGSVILAGTVLTAGIQIGQHVVIMPNVTLTHDDNLSDYVTVCAGAALGGSVRVGSCAYLGMNSSVREGVRVGSHAVLGMGAALLADLPAHETWAGVPARKLGNHAPVEHVHRHLKESANS